MMNIFLQLMIKEYYKFEILIIVYLKFFSNLITMIFYLEVLCKFK